MKIRHCKSVILIILCIVFVFTTVSCAKVAQNQLAEENPPVTDNEPVTTPDPVPETDENKPTEDIEVPFETLSPAEIKEIYDKKDYAKFTKVIQKASPATKESMAQIAIEQRISDGAFISLIKKYCDVNVIEAISIQVQASEAN